MAVCVGIIIVGTAHTFGQAVAGMAIAGSGAAITELTSLAGYFSSFIPMRVRLIVYKYGRACTYQSPRSIPWYGHWLCLPVRTLHPGISAIVDISYLAMDNVDLSVSFEMQPSMIKLTNGSIYNAISLVGVLLFYFPKSHLRGDGITKSEILARIDYVGGLLSIVGLTLL